MSRLLAVFLSLFTATVLAGCASSGQASGQNGQKPGSGPTQLPSATNAPPPQMVRVNEGNNRETVKLHQGDVLLLELHSTYWKVARPAGNVLTQIGKVSYESKPVEARDCVPGSGCGFLHVKFRAEHPGQTKLAASRTTCGEVLRCAADNSSYRLTVVVQ